MTVTDKLLKVFLVDKQLRGLQSRLRAAERFLDEQVKQLAALDAQRAALDATLKSVTALAADREGEAARLGARIDTLRKQMDSATTNKEYKAFLTEVNNFKSDKDKQEQEALELLTKVEEVKAQVAAIALLQEDRSRIRERAMAERADRAAEIQGRVEELKAERLRLGAEVPREAMKHFERLVSANGDEAMAPVELLNKRAREFSCGSCRMTVPFEAINALYGKGSLTMCASCGCILYLEEAVAESLQPASKR